MKKFLVVIAAVCLSTAEASQESSAYHPRHRRFNNDDIFETKGAFADLCNTVQKYKEKTPRFYQTTNLFERLEQCSKQCKKNPYDVSYVRFNQETPSTSQQKIKESNQLLLAAKNQYAQDFRWHKKKYIETPYIDECIDTVHKKVQSTFDQAMQEYSGTFPRHVDPTLAIGVDGTRSAFITEGREGAFVTMGAHNFDMLVEKIIKNESIEHDLAMLKKVFLHELSHPSSNKLDNFLTSCNPSMEGVVENGTHIRAMFNSQDPEETAHLLQDFGAYHAENLHYIARDFRNEREAKNYAPLQTYPSTISTHQHSSNSMDLLTQYFKSEKQATHHSSPNICPLPDVDTSEIAPLHQAYQD